MSPLLQTISDSLSVLGTHWMLLLAILLVVISCQLLMNYVLKGIFGTRLDADEYYALSLSGWLLPASLISLAGYAAGSKMPPQLWVLLLALVLIISLLAWIRRGGITIANGIFTALVLLTVLFLLLRLAFVSRAILPLYFDSAQHYLLTNNLLADLDSSNAGTSFTNYYHLGFHFLAAFITYLARAEITDVMLVLGQIILAIMPFALFFLVRHTTQSYSAAIFALLLAAFGWYMPAHAVDWGKYPALAGIALIPFVLSLAFLSVQNKDLLARGKYVSLNLLLAAGVLVSVFLHSRSLIVLGIAALTWIITSAWYSLPKRLQHVVLGVAISALLAGIAFIQTEGILGPLFDPYANKGRVVTMAVLFLSIFAYIGYPRLVFACIVSTLFFLASLFLPLGTLIPGYVNTTLLDRPFVETILYFPLTMCGGFGLAAFEQMLRVGNTGLANARFLSARWIGTFFITLVAIHAWFSYDLYPSDCCDIAGADDLAAIQWMSDSLPTDARILTSSTELNVLPTDEYQGSAGGDAGTWINPLIGRTTVTLPFNTDFSRTETLAALCELRIDYVYVSKTGWPFNDSGMVVQPDAYTIVMALPGARVYDVTGCEQPSP